ncbi:electron transport complex subunit RsxG [Agaribacter marinus]|uniref:Ion-translocating oxidoreductase complex subunit G n=1 Tax=Agaribacter marinus TaxID=1431249 RepID=A0AA37SV61_9ALTE|nr:electron transport complex subunit RsxG [Agaribacter marinus]GLR69637.1 electron transport complex subunit G [Agaribacter marinus]
MAEKNIVKMMSKKGLTLAIFSVITTGIIAGTFALTKDKIDDAKQRQLRLTLNELVPATSHNNALHKDCIIVSADPNLDNAPQHVYRARFDEQNVAIIIETTAPDGYSGDIDILVAVDSKSTVLGARVLSHKETPGLGDKIELRISDWILDFTGVEFSTSVKDRWKVKKDGGQFDQFTGATITPRAVVSAIAKAAEYVNENTDKLFTAPSNCDITDSNVEVLNGSN